ncbi:tRNA (adenosine(37)-N6)-threonylcarbamoyltransferase complex dimerization subunit type 1 TsaB [Tessaracoccus sp. OS52]|uniref:tRNA (adenosine(37)-N6)-threonylcarbamoyltransferase complex dimerization subunit type 1 TsaB n=1 Tax=Tessaracoccus sp. OS52 TaxID=2886691 RepID=UPI001D1260B0|nr:tRNA (adenosine(37)-N6)-threonylcarbamoyltransferase complex dimerization subunit type 1 TsaB [Tessaracoccus sp. OS52]MCC2592268.1 tRNA (adenosine(37)-N6)-threonylcarbamoyltransferase complex dimerization subunit type 1 TsaB [Tessaracoccus sp. OS52]
MTWTLAIDTSFHVAAGLARDGVPVGATVIKDTRAHGEALMPAVSALCAAHDVALTSLDEFVVGMGPGPFTGLRVGVAAAWTLAALAAKDPRGVCSLDAVALQWSDAPSEFVIASDARRHELYWAHYRDGARVGQPRVTAPEELPDLPVAGAVPENFRSRVRFADGGPTELDPAVLAARWTELVPAGDEPYYLRPADATVGGPPKSALPRLRVKR